MNERARVLGLPCSHFVSPHGAEPANRSCAADLAALTRLAMAERRIARIARISYTADPGAPVKGKRLYLPTTNPLLAAGYRGHDRAEDGLHDGGGPLPDRGRTARRPNAGRRAARLAEPGRAGEAAAGAGVQDERERTWSLAGLEPATSGLQSRRSSN